MPYHGIFLEILIKRVHPRNSVLVKSAQPLKAVCSKLASLSNFVFVNVTSSKVDLKKRPLVEKTALLKLVSPEKEVPEKSAL
jgi:hypothetical protein